MSSAEGRNKVKVLERVAKTKQKFLAEITDLVKIQQGPTGQGKGADSAGESTEKTLENNSCGHTTGFYPRKFVLPRKNFPR